MEEVDKSWITEPNRLSAKYWKGARAFVNRARAFLNSDGKVKCPCINCVNGLRQTPEVLEAHILDRGFFQMYTKWIHHGEPLIVEEVQHVVSEEQNTVREELNAAREQEDEMYEVLNDVQYNEYDVDPGEDIAPGSEYRPEMLQDLFSELEAELWPGCTTFSALNFMVKLMHLKVKNKWTNSSFDELLEMLRQSHPVGNRVPASHYEAKKKLKALGLGYEAIHVCQHDCALFWKENANLDACPVCKESRWCKNERGKNKVPFKVLRYFPIKDRLRRLYGSRHSAQHMRWHQTGKCTEEGVLRHPADGAAWKKFDEKFPTFAADPRNVRLTLAADGFNPFGLKSQSYSMWPVVLATYNLPPWLCMKESHLMLTLLIPGPTAPGKDMDVFLRPMIEELKELWEDGVILKDAVTESLFKLRAAVLWTINDFPARSSLSGHSGQGYLACPTCIEDTPSMRCRDKIVYYDHRRFLPRHHRWRKSKHYKTRIENKNAPKKLSSAEILAQLSHVRSGLPGKHHEFGGKKRGRDGSIRHLNWTKKSIFFELPYWSELSLQHNLDVMHIEKNVCDNFLGTILNLDGKTKDTDKARMDLADLNIKPELHLYREGEKWLKPFAAYTLTAANRKLFGEFIRSVRFPDGFASNLKTNVNKNDGKLSALKSHDCHVIMQRLLGPGVRKFLNKEIRDAITEVCNFFRFICARSLHVDDLMKAQDNIVVLLCKLESIFPPAFFTIMVHLLIHLPEEALEGGPVHLRWMYPFERYLGTLKQYVRNRAKPEGSIAEAYVVNEALTFCSKYLRGVQTRFNKPDRNDVSQKIHLEHHTFSVFKSPCQPFGKATPKKMSVEERNQAQWYIINNCPEIENYLTEHINLLKSAGVPNVEDEHKKQFTAWFSKKVYELRATTSVEDEVVAMAAGPSFQVLSYPACVVNGIKFINFQRDLLRTTQNSGVSVPGVGGDMFYGVLEDVLVLSYLHSCRVVLFKCRWYDTDPRKKRVRTDQNITSVYVHTHWYKNEPYILATQAKQVFYLEDLLNGSQWRVVEQCNNRSVWDIPAADVLEYEENIVQQDVVHVDSSHFTLVVDLTDLDDVERRNGNESSTAVRDEGVLDVQTHHDDDFINDDELEEDPSEYETDNEEMLNEDETD